MKKGKLRFPKDPRRRKQVRTYVQKHGRQGYQQAGSKGGFNSPAKFNSETARAAVAKREYYKKQRQLAAEREKQDENGLSKN